MHLSGDIKRVFKLTKSFLFIFFSRDTPIGDESFADLVRSIYRSSERLSRHGSRSSNASNLSYRSYRGSRSRGGSFRERERAGGGGGGRRGRGQAEGVRKSLSGDVSSSGRNLGVEFKSEVKKAASYDVMSCDISGDVSHSGGATSSHNDSVSYENKRPVFIVGRKDTESFSSSSRTESSGGHAPMSISSGSGARESTARSRSSSAKPERVDSNTEQDDVFLAEASASAITTDEQSFRAVSSDKLSRENSNSLVSQIQQAMPQSQADKQDILQENETTKHIYPDKGSSIAKAAGKDHINSEDEKSQQFPSSTVPSVESINIENKTYGITQGQLGNIPSAGDTHSSQKDSYVFTYPNAICQKTSQSAMTSCDKLSKSDGSATFERTGSQDSNNPEKDATSVQELPPISDRFTDSRQKYHIFSRDPSQDDYFNEAVGVNHTVSVPHQQDRMMGLPEVNPASSGEGRPMPLGVVDSRFQDGKPANDSCDYVKSLSEGSGVDRPEQRSSESGLAASGQSTSKALFNDSVPSTEEIKPVITCNQNGRPELRQLTLSSSSSSSSSSPSSPPPPPPQSPLVLLPQPQPKFAEQQVISLSLTPAVSAAPTPSLVLQPPTPHDPSEPSDGDPTSPADPDTVDIQYV